MSGPTATAPSEPTPSRGGRDLGLDLLRFAALALMVAAHYSRCIPEGTAFTALYRFRNTQTGQVVEVRGSAAPLHDAHRNVVGWVGTLDPIERSANLDTALSVEES